MPRKWAAGEGGIFKRRGEALPCGPKNMALASGTQILCVLLKINIFAPSPKNRKGDCCRRIR